MPKYRGSRIEARIYNKPTASGRAAWYADFRDLGKFGGKLEALKAYGSRMATADREEAILIASRRLKELRELEAATVPYSVDKCQLGALFAAYRTARASERHSPTKQWLRDLDRHGARAIRFFGEDFDVTAFTPDHIQDFEGWLEGAPHARGSGFSEGSIHQHLCTLSGMYGWGMRKRLIPGPQNLVNVARRGAKGRIRSPRYRTSDFLDWDEITEMLRFTAAITRSDETPHFHERIATGCYTGARDSEIRRLRVQDIMFEQGLVRITNAKVRPGETPKELYRYPPLFPHFAEIMKGFLESDRGPRSGLLFVDRYGRPAPDPRRQRERIPVPERFFDPHHPLNLHPDDPPASIGFRMLRHSYCTARLQTLDGGKPIQKFTVQKEMGHGSGKMIDGIYGHLGALRVRKEYLDFR